MSPPEDAPWTEKYRPKRIDDICHQETVKEALRSVVKTHNMPHLLFFGPPGTGKTTAILALCRELFGPQWKKRTRELNASDDRGIQAVRERVKSFAEQAVASLPPEDQARAPPYKIIILDEADMMTLDAQTCLRRVMEDFCRTTRFVLICNYVSKIISPIQSRCASYRFEPVKNTTQVERVALIAQQEKIDITPTAVDRLVLRSYGDMRLAINTLYTIHCSGRNQLSALDVDQMIGYLDVDARNKFMETVTNKDATSTQINETVEDTVADGWDIELILNSIGEECIWRNPDLDNIKKAMLAQAFASIQVALANGANDYTALMMCALELNKTWTMKTA